MLGVRWGGVGWDGSGWLVGSSTGSRKHVHAVLCAEHRNPSDQMTTFRIDCADALVLGAAVSAVKCAHPAMGYGVSTREM